MDHLQDICFLIFVVSFLISRYYDYTRKSQPTRVGGVWLIVMIIFFIPMVGFLIAHQFFGFPGLPFYLSLAYTGILMAAVSYERVDSRGDGKITPPKAVLEKQNENPVKFEY